jgi:acyl-coenzyme A synthetase/AMP-(fatty) acid ligase
VLTTADGPVTPVGIEQRVELLESVRAAAVVGVGPLGNQQVVVVVVPSETPKRGDVLAGSALAADVRAAAEQPVAAVLTLPALPVDIRHASKVDRARVGRWAARVLSGARPGRL